jgi:hypothetical protein
MLATPVNEQETDCHQHTADGTELGAGHENEFLKPGLELLGESEVGQPLEKAYQSDDCYEIFAGHVSTSTGLDSQRSSSHSSGIRLTYFEWLAKRDID